MSESHLKLKVCQLILDAGVKRTWCYVDPTVPLYETNPDILFIFIHELALPAFAFVTYFKHHLACLPDSKLSIVLWPKAIKMRPVLLRLREG